MTKTVIAFINYDISKYKTLNFEIFYVTFSGKRRPSDTHGGVENVPDISNESSNGTSQFEPSGLSRASPSAGNSLIFIYMHISVEV